MAYEINWHVAENDPVLLHPLYVKYSSKTAFQHVLLPAVQADILAAAASNESAPVVNYLCWLVRVIGLTA